MRMGAEVTLPVLRDINATAAFNRWAGFDVVSADAGQVELRIEWRPEFGQYAGFLHAGMVSALIDTACGFAAATATGGPVLASHCAVSYVAPAKGEVFLARAQVRKAGRRQVFATAELVAVDAGSTIVVAIGETILVPTA